MIKNLLNADEERAAPAESEPRSPESISIFSLAATVETPAPSETVSIPITAAQTGEFDSSDWGDATEPVEKEPAIVVTPYEPPSKVETIRQSGLAWSVGIIFFGSVVFTLILGWFADLLLGTSPWGLVGGIILGSVIGFVQFFRISSQIFKN